MFQVGTSKTDITAEPGVELCGFANRQQPSTVVLDNLYASVLYLQDQEGGFFFINLDLIGIEKDFAARLREKIRIKYNIPIYHIQIFATHTHSAPGSIHLNFCGEYDSGYVEFLFNQIMTGCERAAENMEDCLVSFSEGSLPLGINRRNGGQADLKLKTLLFIGTDGNYKAVLVNYPMHPVGLKGTGISADYPGVVKKRLRQELPGDPVVLFGLGAAGDIDPPGVGVGYEQMAEWGEEIAVRAFEMITGRSGDQDIGRLVNWEIRVVFEGLSEEEIDAYANKYLDEERWHKEFGEVFATAVEKWRQDMKRKIGEKKGMPENESLEISVLEIAGNKLIFVSAELFNKFERILEERLESPFMVISCANGMEGYFPSKEEYDKGGYELETAIFFYNSFLPRKGSLEQIAGKTVQMANNKH